MSPGIKGTTKIYKLNPKAKTLYLSIPSEITKDSRFPFKKGERVKIELDTTQQKIIISKFD